MSVYCRVETPYRCHSLRSTFDHLSKANDSLNQAMAADEARACQDLLSQAEYHLDRARSREEQERVVRKRQVC